MININMLFTRKRKIIIFLIIFLILAYFIFNYKLYLIFKFFTGEGVVVALDSDKEYLSLKHGENQDVNFEARITTNPFCSASCDYVFRDIGKDKIIEKDRFELKTAFPFTKKYNLQSPENGEGVLLYRFDMSCSNVESTLCRSSGESSTRSILVGVNYSLSDNEVQAKEFSKEKINELTKEIGTVKGEVYSLRENLQNLRELNQIDYNARDMDFNGTANKFINDWNDWEYYSLKIEIENFEEEFYSYKKDIEEDYNKSVEDIQLYNRLLDNLTFTREILTYKSNNEIIEEFNTALDTFEERKKLNFKKELVEGIYLKALNLENATLGNITTNTIGFEQINISQPNEMEFQINLEDIKAECCISNNCDACCNDCYNENYPTVFLHGHAVSEKISADYSLETFNKIIEKLEKDGFLYGGSITLFSEKEHPYGIYGMSNASLTYKGSYYFDLFHQPENYIVVQSKSESIDTYSIRVKELIDTVKYKTGKDKVNIVAFSMGGLVTRNYLRIFGTENVNKVILIGTPNKGIVGEIAFGCDIIGNELECRDMEEGSLFLNKLNREKINIDIINVVGTGCEMLNGMGDGAVLERNARLDDAKNYLIYGKCESVAEPLHLDLLDIEKYPEVYEIIKENL